MTVRGAFALAGILKVGETHLEGSGQAVKAVKAYFSTFEDLFGESLKELINCDRVGVFVSKAMHYE
ncbi:hypothetical protein D3C86_2024830 [compost metagenome]